MIKIAVCVKQVPADKVGTDRTTGNLEREKASGCMNMYDYAGIETALRIKDQVPACVDVFTMGPKSAEHVLRETKALGADHLHLVSDSAFSGSDVLATSYILFLALSEAGGYDLILCGKQTTDGDTAQVAGALAGRLGRPYLPWVSEILAVEETSIKVRSQMDLRKVQYEAQYPCVLSVEPGIYTVRIPTLKHKMASKRADITIWDRQLLNAEWGRIGQRGSATKVIKLEVQEKKQPSQVLELETHELKELISREIR